MPTAPTPAARALSDQVGAVIAKREPEGHRIAIRNVERRTRQLQFSGPGGLHVTDLIDAKARLERALDAMTVAA